MAHVLIVEDDQADRTILGSILEGLGHKVYFATDGKHALKIYVKNRIDVVVTDLQMPYVDGLGAHHDLEGVVSRGGGHCRFR